MTDSALTGLISNIGLLLALGVLHEWLLRQPRRGRSLMQIPIGLSLGLIGMAVMLAPWELAPGVFYDTRSILLSLGGLFFGPLPALLAGAMTATLRGFQGGAGALVGIGVILSSVAIGLLWRRYGATAERGIEVLELHLFGLMVHGVMLLWMLLLPEPNRFDAIARIGLPVIVLYPLVTVLLGMLLNYQQERSQIQRLVQSLVDNVPDLVLRFDTNLRFRYVNSALQALTGRARRQVLRQPLEALFPERAAWAWRDALSEVLRSGQSRTLDFTLRGLDGRDHRFEARIVPEFAVDNQRTTLLAVARDITERLQAEDRIHRLAFYDPVTHLPNRRLLRDRLEQLLHSDAAIEEHGALLFIDLDQFRNLNDTQGYDTGDQLLRLVAERLLSAVAREAIVARHGADEFVVLLERLDEDRQQAAIQAQRVAEDILAAINRPCDFTSGDGAPISAYHVTACIGVVLFPESRETDEDLLKRADAAMYQAKHMGRNLIHFYDPEAQAAFEQRLALETALSEALTGEQLHIHYQPQVGHDGRLLGVEALLRWQHPRLGMISPAEFIPLAEGSGLILPIGRRVLETACRQLRRWADEPATRDLSIAVNISVRQFREAGFVAEVRDVLERTGADPGRLKLEITESLLLDDIPGSIARMEALKTLGLAFSIDDFGTGYSSLAYIKRLPMTELKIDQSFVRDLDHEDQDTTIVRTIVVMAHSLGLGVIAEGVETETQLRRLQALGCEAFQGYWLGQPMALDALERWMRERETETTCGQCESIIELSENCPMCGSAGPGPYPATAGVPRP